MKLLCLGDSLTQGNNIPQTSRWTELLQRELKIEIVNCGISGDTTTGMLGRCERLLIEHAPTHMIVLGGTNDLWFGLNDELIISNIHAISRQAKFHSVESIIGILPPSINLNVLNFIEENYSECIRSFQNALIDYSIEDERPYINFSLNMNTDHFLDDGVHPNQAGQIIMKDNAKRSIESL